MEGREPITVPRQKLNGPDVLIVFGLLLALAPWMAGGRDALAMLISAAGLTAAGLLALRRYDLRGVTSSFLVILIAAWLGWGALSQLWSVNRYQSQLWLLMMLLAALAAFIAVIQPKLNRRYLLGGYIAIATLFAVAGIWMYATGDYDRLTSTFYWANPAAAYLMPAVLLASWWGITRRNYWLIAAALITATGFWLTDSRGATLVLLLVLLPLGLFAGQVRRRWKGLLLIALLSFGAAWGLSLLKSDGAVKPGSRYAEAAQGESTSGNDRLSYLEASFAIWWDNPGIGTGAGTFGTVHPQYQQRPTSAATDPHNIYVQALVEQGVVGASLLGWVLFLVIVGVVHGVARHPERAPIAVAPIALLVHFGLDINGRYPALLVLVAVLLALVYRPIVPSTPPGHARPTIMLLLVIVLAMAALNFQSVTARQHAQTYNENFELDKAAASNEQARSVLIYDPDAWNAEGIDYYVLATINQDKAGNLERARDRANQAIQRDPKDAQHYFLLARVERVSGNKPAALAAYSRALELDRQNHAEYYADLALLQVEMGDVEGARQTINTALQKFNDEVIKNRSADTQMKPAVETLRRLQEEIK